MHLPESLLALDSLLNSLRNHKTDLLRQLEQIDPDIAVAERNRARLCSDAMSVSNLPPELLSYIFLLCQKDHPDFQLIAAQVCTRWREMAVSTRMFWTNIRISLWHHTRIQHALDKMGTYISRSGPATLFSLRLNVHVESGFTAFLKLVASHILRCDRLSVCVREHKKACLLLHEHLKSLWALHLRYLALHVDNADDGYNRITCGTPSFFQAGAPSINHLKLTGFASGLRPPTSGNITTLHLDGSCMLDLTVLEYRRVLAANRCLVNLSLRGLKIVDSSTSTESRPLDLPMLRSLRIHANPIEQASNKALLNALPLFRLESLILQDITDLYSFEFPNVEDLTLYWCMFPEDQIGHLMLAFPSVVRLMLDSEIRPVYMALSVGGEPPL
ncbi:hypothetical protein FB446DRAFT_638221 [Lentinula raphanica]|nr:hypothetical protein FB446DRAFT_638221 [Lentinula raphanica]